MSETGLHCLNKRSRLTAVHYPQKVAAESSLEILPIATRILSYCFCPALATPDVYWRIKDGLIPASSATFVTFRNEK